MKEVILMMAPVGIENFIHVKNIVAIIRPDNSPAKKLRHKAQKARQLINVTGGRISRILRVMKGSHVILSSLQTSTF